jgi:FKBP-type peptidyl-prolyl cis-trans isomerase (trigger factor)
LFVNVSVENLAPCKKLVRVEVEAQQVDETFDSITKDFQRSASLPGFRPGKAPRDMVLRKYEKDITDEVKRKLISDSYRKVIPISRKSNSDADKRFSSPPPSRRRRILNCRITKACPSRKKPAR